MVIEIKQKGINLSNQDNETRYDIIVENHGHSGLLTIELEDTVDPVTGFAHACKDGLKKRGKFVTISTMQHYFKKATRFLSQLLMFTKGRH